jgi:hypothetical protein
VVVVRLRGGGGSRREGGIASATAVAGSALTQSRGIPDHGKPNHTTLAVSRPRTTVHTRFRCPRACPVMFARPPAEHKLSVGLHRASCLLCMKLLSNLHCASSCTAAVEQPPRIQIRDCGTASSSIQPPTTVKFAPLLE